MLAGPDPAAAAIFSIEAAWPRGAAALYQGNEQTYEAPFNPAFNQDPALEGEPFDSVRDVAGPLGYRLMLGDCFRRMAEIPDNCAQLIWTGPPYGCTGLDWDTLRDWRWDVLWREFHRMAAPGGTMAFQADARLAARLICTNEDLKYFTFRYENVWQKNNGTNGFAKGERPGKVRHEKIVIFKKPALDGSDCWPFYHPYQAEGASYKPWDGRDRGARTGTCVGGGDSWHAGNPGTREIPSDIHGPDYDLGPEDGDWICGPRDSSGRAGRRKHPTPCPIWLSERQIRLFTDPPQGRRPGGLVVDPFAGGCTAGFAAINCGRRFVGIERDPGIYAMGLERMRVAYRGCSDEYWRVKSLTNSFTQERQLLDRLAQKDKELAKKDMEIAELDTRLRAGR